MLRLFFAKISLITQLIIYGLDTMPSIFLAGHGLTQNNKTVDYPRPDRLVNGNPKRLTTELYNHPNMNCGIWECEVGSWNIVFAPNKQEFFQIIEGIVRLHDAQTGQFVEITTGDAGVIPPSFKGIFEVVEKVQKYYVVVETEVQAPH